MNDEKKSNSTLKVKEPVTKKDRKMSELQLAEQAYLLAQKNLDHATNHERETHNAFNKSTRQGASKFNVEKILSLERVNLKKELKLYKGNAEGLTYKLHHIIENYKLNKGSTHELIYFIDTLQELVLNLKQTLETSKNPFTLLRTTKLLDAVQPVYGALIRFRSQLLETRFDHKFHEEKKKEYDAAKQAKRKASDEFEKASELYFSLTGVEK